jgi:hypothetical protein
MTLPFSEASKDLFRRWGVLRDRRHSMRRKQAKECRISENEGRHACLVRRASEIGAGRS